MERSVRVIADARRQRHPQFTSCPASASRTNSGQHHRGELRLARRPLIDSATVNSLARSPRPAGEAGSSPTSRSSARTTGRRLTSSGEFQFPIRITRGCHLLHGLRTIRAFGRRRLLPAERPPPAGGASGYARRPHPSSRAGTGQVTSAVHHRTAGETDPGSDRQLRDDRRHAPAPRTR